MGILRTKIYRDLRYNKGRAISIIVIVAISTALYGGLLLAYHDITDSFKQQEDQLHIESVRYSFPQFINTSQLLGLNLNQYSNIQAWDYRLSIVTSLKLTANSSETFTTSLYGTPDIPKVNNFKILDGSFFTQPNSSEVLLIQHFVDANKLKLGSKLFIQTPFNIKEMTLKASVFSPEFIYNVNPVTGLPDLSGLAAGWVSLPQLQHMYNLTNEINEVLIRFNPDVTNNQNKLDNAISLIKSKLEGLSPVINVVKLQDEGEQKMKNGDVGALDDFARVFGSVILLLALFAIYDNISKLIYSQRNYIGTMRALGGGKWKVALHYTNFASILGLIAVILGLPLGWLISYEMTIEYSKILGIPSPSTAFHISPFYEALIVNFGLVFLVGIISSISAANILPREAMSSAFVSMIYKSKPILEKFFTKLPGMKSATSLVPMRLIFRHKRRTIVTIITFSLSLVLMISALGFSDSFNYAISDNYNNYQKYDMEVYFALPQSFANVKPIITSIPGIAVIEQFGTTQLEVSHDGMNKSVGIYGFLSNSTLRKFNLGSKGSSNGLVVGQILAQDLKLKQGDTLNILNHSMKISGITNEMISEDAYLPLNVFQSTFGLGNSISGVLIKVGNGYNVKDIKKEILNLNLPISLVLSSNEVRDSIQTLIQGLFAIISVLVFIGFIVIALFSFNTIVLDVMQRELEFVNIRALGGGRRKIAKMIILQSIFISLLGSIIAVPLSYLIEVYLFDATVKGLMVLPIVITPESYLLGIISAFIATSVGIWAAVRHTMKINLVDALRTRVNV